MNTLDVSSITSPSRLKMLTVFVILFLTFNVAKAMEKLAITGTKISLSSPTPIFEIPYDYNSKVIGYSLRYYVEFRPNYGTVGELSFLKIGDYCTDAALTTSETVTAIAIPSKTTTGGN